MCNRASTLCEAAVLRRDGGEADYYDDEGDARKRCWTPPLGRSAGMLAENRFLRLACLGRKTQKIIPIYGWGAHAKAVPFGEPSPAPRTLSARPTSTPLRSSGRICAGVRRNGFERLGKPPPAGQQDRAACPSAADRVPEEVAECGEEPCRWTHEDLQGCQEEQGCCSSRVVAPLSGAVFETCLVALDIVCLKQIARTRYTIVILQHMCDSKRRSRRATLRLVAHARCTARSLQLS